MWKYNNFYGHSNVNTHFCYFVSHIFILPAISLKPKVKQFPITYSYDALMGMGNGSCYNQLFYFEVVTVILGHPVYLPRNTHTRNLPKSWETGQQQYYKTL